MRVGGGSLKCCWIGTAVAAAPWDRMSVSPCSSLLRGFVQGIGVVRFSYLNNLAG